MYLPALQNGFVWDDDAYVIKNIHVHTISGNSLYWMITAFHAGNWHPLTWFSHAVDCALWGLNPAKHHLTNILLHGLNTSLVFILVITLLAKIDSQKSRISENLIAAGVTSVLFGLHPLHVESAAWVAERKDLLCAFFYILSILFYTSYVFSGVKRRRQVWYVTCLLLFSLALMSKPMAVTLPVILLLLDYYPFRRFKLHPSETLRIITEKIPFFVLSLCSGILTIFAQHAGGALKTLEQLILTTRLLNALRILMFYLGKIFCPVNLVPFYPFSVVSYSEYLLYGFLALAITGLCVWMARKKMYAGIVIWCYYLVTLFPVLGIIQVGGQMAADRYTYLPSLAPLLLVGVVCAWTWRKASVTGFAQTVRCSVLLFILLIALACGLLTVQQIKVWRNPEALWGRVNGVFPGGVQEGYYNLGVYYSDQGRVDEAIEQFNTAITINPRNAQAYNNLGIAYTKKMMLDEAIAEYKRALVLDPRHAKAYYNLGIAYFKQSKYDLAITEFKNAIAVNPDYARAHYNLGNTYDKKGLWDEAITEHKRALALNPRYAEACNNLAVIYCYKKKEFTLAAAYCKEAVRLGYKVHPMLLEALKPYL